ncbi:phosphate signaling complex protein PhoU [Sandaracinus amylolyticus]|uniref:Phosphate-specific transport system accessory protein PhoU n=1 Tax=Sandaracinus amylolyticus TaxID=927083 RepID=A0A0F6YJE0_9BACT|nr:phosphate signaling complex protein PhoU [Sandaracinus amylolyticus]AKF07232.1 Phosphate transport system regulatory protein PhoU [Sandaracinus amylolyticus]
MGTHTSRAYEQELRDLKARLLAMGARCESLIHMASRAFENLDSALAHEVEESDRTLNIEEMAIDQMTVRILALRQPVGRDLRFLVTALKVVTDLERIGDEAVNVAERTVELAAHPPIANLQPKLAEMADAASRMVRMALDSFVEEDANMARRVLREDDAVDALYGELLRMSMQFIRSQPERVEDGMRIASCAKYLERIADHATNIAEMVIYMVSGDDVRHFVSRSSSS